MSQPSRPAHGDAWRRAALRRSIVRVDVANLCVRDELVVEGMREEVGRRALDRVCDPAVFDDVDTSGVVAIDDLVRLRGAFVAPRFEIEVALSPRRRDVDSRLGYPTKMEHAR